MNIRIVMLFILIFPISGYAEFSLDDKLSLIIKLNELSNKDCNVSQYIEITEDEKKLGELLFTTLLLSGNKDTSCQTCHLDEFHSTDGLPLAVGVGGHGEGVERYADGEGVLVQRNAFTMFGRGLPEFKNYFWDGKLDTDDKGRVISQFGDLVSNNFEAQLSAAAILPLIERDEFLGKTSYINENEIQISVGDKLYNQRYLAISKAVRERLLSDPEANDIREYFLRLGFKLEYIELADLGNMIGKFIADNFKCSESQFDKYIAGDLDALTEEQKKGAVLFYGRGRCSNCHAGNVQSDFKFHSIGVPQGLFGPHTRHRDLGRAAVTLRQEDLYQFRTPPLLDVANTPPYGHNGVFKTLRGIVVHHINPIEFFMDERNYNYNTLDYGKVLDSRSPILSSISIYQEEEVDQLVKFLGAL